MFATIGFIVTLVLVYSAIVFNISKWRKQYGCLLFNENGLKVGNIGFDFVFHLFIYAIMFDAIKEYTLENILVLMFLYFVMLTSPSMIALRLKSLDKLSTPLPAGRVLTTFEYGMLNKTLNRHSIQNEDIPDICKDPFFLNQNPMIKEILARK